MAGHSSWWSMASLSHSHQQQSSSTTSTTSNDNSLLLSSVMGSSSTTLSHNYIHNYNLELPYQPQSWSQLLVSGILGGDHEDQERNNAMKLENWQHQYQILNINSNSNSKDDDHDHLIKQEISQRSDNNRLYNHGHEKFHQDQALLLGSNASSWSINSNNNGVYMDFSGDHDHFANRVNQNQYQQHQHQFSPESSSTATASGGGPCKKARVRPSSTQPPPKVRKEKLGDRITTLHQLVSPFGKTDTASVLLEAIGYIRFLHSQIEALSSPYMKATSSSSSSSNNFMRRIKQTAQESRPRNLRSRGLCLVPLSCTQHVDNNNGALYWPSTIDGGF